MFLFNLLSFVSCNPGMALFTLTREPPIQHLSNLVKRSDNITVDLKNRINQFTTTLEIGSNKQKVRVIVDTGSSDLWVMAKSNPFCSSVSNNDDDVDNSTPDSNGQIVCSSDAMFNTSSSSSWSANNTQLRISYKDTTFANGTFGRDTVSYGGIEISNANFAVASSTNISSGVWGIGLISTESIVSKLNTDGSFGPTYSNLPLQMKEQGLIGQNAYSLWLNDVQADSGELLFGGVDHAKYQGQLQTVPLISSYQNANPNMLQIMLNGISLYQGNSNTQVASFALPALLDSGSTLMIMPSVFLEPIAKSIGAVYSSRYGYVAPCGMAGGLTFDFSGIQINVPFSEISFPLGRNMCMLGFQPSEDSYFILGDTFLRSAYVVYDLDNNEISLANTNYNVTSSSLEAISGSVPGATRAPSYSSTRFATTYSTQVVTNFQTGKFTGTVTTGTVPIASITSEAISSVQKGSSIATGATATSKKNDARRNQGALAAVAAGAMVACELLI